MERHRGAARRRRRDRAHRAALALRRGVRRLTPAIEDFVGGPIDFGRHSRDYATERPGPPDTFYDRLDRLRALRGARALNLGTGPGVLALELAARGATVVGLDISENQIDSAREVAQARGLACRFEGGSAEQTKQPDASFDLVTAGTCWHWFDHARALAECALAPGRLLAIVNYTYLPQHSALVRESEALVLNWNPGWKLASFNGMFPLFCVVAETAS